MTRLSVDVIQVSPTDNLNPKPKSLKPKQLEKALDGNAHRHHGWQVVGSLLFQVAFPPSLGCRAQGLGVRGES